MMHWEQLREQFMDYSSWMYEAMLFSIVAFVIGFFARIFGKPLVYLLVGGFVAVFLLYSFRFISINKFMLIRVFGVSGSKWVTLFGDRAKLWLVNHFIGCCFGFVAFFFGWKMGK